MDLPPNRSPGPPWFWIILVVGLVIVFTIAIAETTARRNQVRDRSAGQESLR